MTQEQFFKILKRSVVVPYLISDPSDIRFPIGMVIGILGWHIPLNITYQEKSPLLPFHLRAHKETDPAYRRYLESLSVVRRTPRILIAIWRNREQ
jgi:hypothetical protein